MAKQVNDIRDIVRDGVQPDRAADSLRVCNSARGGFTTWRKKRVVRIDAPMRSGAQARTIRIHELLHANHSPVSHNRKFPELAQQAIEDARVHSVYWPNSMPRRANRDCLATALNEMRTIRPMAELGRAEDWNLSLLVALRAMAIMSRLDDKRRHRDRLQSRLLAAFGSIVVEKLDDILRLVKSRKTKALREFTALMRDDDKTIATGGNGSGNGSHGKETANPMRIVRLPMPEVCNSAIRRTSFARSGARLNRARLVRAVATGSTVGLFIRTRYLAGGTYLFDASGSMHLSDTRLNELCRLVPAAQVAYYSGGRGPDSTGCYGELVIYAANGRRADYCDHIHGGNEVDLYAIQWLLKQPGPRVFISDGGFCGGPAGQDVRAAALLAGAVANGQVVWHQSIYGLEKALGLCE